MSRRQERGEGATAAPGLWGPRVGLLLLAGLLAAIFVQDHSGRLPLGIFNDGRELYRALSHACLAAALVAVAVFVAELVRGRVSRPGAVLRALLVTLVMSELVLAALDIAAVSRNPEGRIGGPYWETRSGSGEWVFLKRAHAGSPHGFRTAEPYALAPPHPRLLFLGDSYTEGSGRAPGCNYPDVVGSALSRRVGRPVQVMNAGVSGYGPLDALHLLDLLVERGYRFDAVVYNLFLENDFTDDLPGTQRRVVAGMSFRFPDQAWVRALHPLDTRLFRTTLFLVRIRELAAAGNAAVRRDEGACRLEEGGGPPSAGLLTLARRRLEANYAPDDPRTADALVIEALRAMAARAAGLGVPFTLVVFPDRVAVDASLREALGVTDRSHDLARLARLVEREVGDVARIDVAPALADPALYRPSDTHLSDRGNQVAGAFVAERLAALLPFLAPQR